MKITYELDVDKFQEILSKLLKKNKEGLINLLNILESKHSHQLLQERRGH